MADVRHFSEAKINVAQVLIFIADKATYPFVTQLYTKPYCALDISFLSS